MKLVTRISYVCLAVALLAGATFATACTPDPVTTTRTITATSTTTETLPPETITRTTTFLPEPTIPNQIAEGITVTEANSLIQANKDNPEFVVIDVRTPEERSLSYIEGSILLDWNAGIFEAEIQSFDRCNTYLLY